MMIGGRLSIVLAAFMAAPSPAMELPVAGARLSVPVSSIKALRFQRTMHQQYDYSCGSAALATLLTYHYGQAVTERQVFEQMYLDGDRARIRKEGFSLLDMQRFLARRGMQADGFALPLAKLAAARLPALVLIADKGYRHFVVVKGIRDGRVLLGDPARGTRALTVADFNSKWIGNLLFVIHGEHGKRARFNDPGDWGAAPSAPLALPMLRDPLNNITLPRHGPGDF